MGIDDAAGLTHRRWVRSAVALLLLGAALAAIGPARAQDAREVVEACSPLTAVPELGPRACRSVESGLWLAAQTCRRLPATGDPATEPADTVCPTIDGRRISEAAMREFESSWLARALALQRDLDRQVPLTEAMLTHTHNSANSTAYDPTLSSTDANQVLSLTDQLRLGVRAIEIDVHWTPNPAGDPNRGFNAVVQCHGEPIATPGATVHAGCSIDRPLVELLEELRSWLDQPASGDDLVLLYLENALDGDPAAHDAAVAAIQATIGDLVRRPRAGGGCQPLPVEQSRAALTAGGRRVLLTGNCGPGGWTDWVFERGDRWDESGSTTDFTCAADRSTSNYDTDLIRRYEDSTWLSAMAGGGSHISPAVMEAMVHCGVNLPGFDQLHPGDPRLPMLVWSWRADEPAAGDANQCAIQGSDGRFAAAACDRAVPAACRTTTSPFWAVTDEAVPWAAIDDACRAAGQLGAGTPTSAVDNDRLRAVAAALGHPDVWLAYAQDAEGTWRTGPPGG